MIEFLKENGELLLRYEPEPTGSNDYLKRLVSSEGYVLRRVFFVCGDLLRETDGESVFTFCVGREEGAYTRLDPAVFMTDHTFYIANDIPLTPKTFIASRNISILRKIDQILGRDCYIGGDWEAVGGLSREAFQQLIDQFPGSAELDKYANMRVSMVLREFFAGCDEYERIYDRYIRRKRENTGYLAPVPEPSEYNVRLRLEQYRAAYRSLAELLENYQAVSEKRWQTAVQDILLLLYPQYICSTREVSIPGLGRRNKRPDFLLVDVNGFVDILEIKKADVLLLVKYRDNYVPSRELSGAIQQVEKYLYCLNASDRARSAVCQKLGSALPDGVSVRVANPRGLLLLGRGDGLNEEQSQDLELIRRQYKHVADIMTYDDLLARLRNIVSALEKRLL